MPTLEEIRTRFREDRFATEAAGAEIVLAEPGHAVCKMKIEPGLLNANGVVMGGAVFTLADFAFAVASNAFCKEVTVARQVSVTFLSAAKGTELLAEAKCLKDGRRTSLYQIDVTDDTGCYVAHVTGNGFCVGEFVK